jgi:energy-coupling factor transporter transmembrane protein EcfT
VTGNRLTFRFEGRASPARSWDIRFRVAATTLVSAGVLASPTAALVPLAFGVGALLALAGSTVWETARVVRGFAGFLGFFVVLGVAFDPTWAQAGFLATQAVRLTLLLLLGHFLFLAATPGDVTEGIRWYLGWLGPRRAWAASSMAGWALASVPLVLDQAATLLDAAALRGLTARRHPLKAMKLLTLALLVRTVTRSTDLASALEARGFGLAVPPPLLKSGVRDFAGLAAVAAGVAASWAFGSILGS